MYMDNLGDILAWKTMYHLAWELHGMNRGLSLDPVVIQGSKVSPFSLSTVLMARWMKSRTEFDQPYKQSKVQVTGKILSNKLGQACVTVGMFRQVIQCKLKNAHVAHTGPTLRHMELPGGH